jgi:hypothetical protein
MEKISIKIEKATKLKKKVVVQIKGGLGNQLFQWAHGYSVAKETNSNLYLDFSFYESKKNGSYNDDRDMELSFLENTISGYQRTPFLVRVLYFFVYNWRKIFNRLFLKNKENGSDFLIKWRGDIFLFGYWQTPNAWGGYFDDVINEIHNSIIKVNQSKNDIHQRYNYGIHIRRGDYENDINKLTLGLLDIEYFRRVLVEVDCESVLVFTDDIVNVKNSLESLGLGIDFHYHESGSGLEVLLGMFLCRNLVLSNSTLSWWGGVLTGASVIAPNPWYQNLNTDLSLLPRQWDRQKAIFLD